MNNTRRHPLTPSVLDAIQRGDSAFLWSQIKRLYRFADASETQYELGIRQWLTFCAEHGIDPLAPPSRADQQWMDELIANGLSAAAADYRKYGPMNLLKMLDFLGVTARPFSNVDAGGNSRSPRRTYAESEVTRMLESARWPERAIIHWHVDHGLRLHHLLKLRWKEIEGRHAIVLKDGRRVHLSPGLDNAIHESPNGTRYVVPFRTSTRARQRFRELTAEVGVPYRGIDVLRQHYA